MEGNLSDALCKPVRKLKDLIELFELGGSQLEDGLAKSLEDIVNDLNEVADRKEIIISQEIIKEVTKDGKLLYRLKDYQPPDNMLNADLPSFMNEQIDKIDRFLNIVDENAVWGDVQNYSQWLRILKSLIREAKREIKAVDDFLTNSIGIIDIERNTIDDENHYITGADYGKILAIQVRPKNEKAPQTETLARDGEGPDD